MAMAQRFTPHQRAGWVAGLGAGALLTIVMIVLNRGFGFFSLPELVAYRIIAVLPLPLFSLGIRTLGGYAKQLLLVLVVVGQVLTCGLLGVLWASMAETVPGERRPERRLAAFWPPVWRGGLLFASFLLLLVEVALLPLLDAGFLGATLGPGIGLTAAAAALEALVFGIALVALYRARMNVLVAGSEGAGPRLSRRELLRQAVAGVALLSLGGAALTLLKFMRQGDAAAASGEGGRIGNGGLPPEVTPTEAFYQVSKNFADPKVSVESWKLEIGGLVEQPYSLTLAEIRALPPVTDYRTLCCISNEVGGDLISNAGWKGVRLKDLIERAGVKPGAVDLQLSARDGYVESFPIQKALTPDVLAVYEMNGAPLTDSHGFPLRLLVPDIYGMKNVKWVTRLDVVGADIKGYWQEKGWSDVATVQTMSRFDFPRSRQLLSAGRNRVGGVAFAGARGIGKVEMTRDGGQTWQEGQIRRPLGPYTWVLWTADVDLPEGGHHLAVRATDGTGAVQTDRSASPAPDGATGWHTVSVRAAGSGQSTPAGERDPNPTPVGTGAEMPAQPTGRATR